MEARSLIAALLVGAGALAILAGGLLTASSPVPAGLANGGGQVASAAGAAPAGRGAGLALFVGKGCATCHPHAALPGVRSLQVGPELTRYRGDAAFLRRWLANPATVRPGTMMPVLPLDAWEIEALVALLAAPDADR